MADFALEGHGSVVLLRPLTDAGRAWIDTHVHVEHWMRWGDAICVEPRYVVDLVAGFVGEGLTLAGQEAASA